MCFAYHSKSVDLSVLRSDFRALPRQTHMIYIHTIPNEAFNQTTVVTTHLEAVHAPGGAVRLPHLVVYGGEKEEELSRQS